jgi:cytochrome c oxidase assembly factor CtaG
LQDQQLGGAIMWIPGGVIFLAVAMIMLWRVMLREKWEDAAPARARTAA